MTPPPTTSTASYSPFWALFAFFAALTFLQASYLLNDISERDRLQSAQIRMNAALHNAKIVNQTLESTSQDLLTLSAESAEAAKIVTEFKIQFTTPAKLDKN